MKHAVRLPADLAVLRGALRRYLHELGLAGDVVDDLALATTEIVTNGLAVAAPRTGVSTTTLVRPVRDGRQVEIEIRNVGVGFPGDVAGRALGSGAVPPGPMPPASALRGRGLAIAGRLTDALHVERLVGGTAVRLTRLVGHPDER